MFRQKHGFMARIEIQLLYNNYIIIDSIIYHNKSKRNEYNAKLLKRREYNNCWKAQPNHHYCKKNCPEIAIF